MIDTIVTDLDDTLLNEEGEISDYALSVMKECQKRGIRVIPSSGRTQASMEPYLKKLGTHLPYIACNGAQIVNADHSLLECLTLPAEQAREFCRFFRAEGCYVQAYLDECFYYDMECSYSQDYRRSSKMEGVPVGDLVSFLTFDTPKLLGIGEPAMIEALYPKIKARFGDSATFSVSKPFFLEVVPPEAGKGAGLLRLADRIGIDPKRTAVFGDSLNDLSMLAFTENSVAMGNAREEVKKAARYVCLPNSQDGMARFVKEHYLA